eukprot:COSAG06_NODE_917_length_11555_cov_62.488041_9_plen_325_part_00
MGPPAAGDAPILIVGRGIHRCCCSCYHRCTSQHPTGTSQHSGVTDAGIRVAELRAGARRGGEKYLRLLAPPPPAASGPAAAAAVRASDRALASSAGLLQLCDRPPERPRSVRSTPLETSEARCSVQARQPVQRPGRTEQHGHAASGGGAQQWCAWQHGAAALAHGLGAWLRLQVAVELWRWTVPATAGAVRFGGRVAARHQGPVTEAADGSRSRSCCSAARARYMYASLRVALYIAAAQAAHCMAAGSDSLSCRPRSGSQCINAGVNDIYIAGVNSSRIALCGVPPPEVCLPLSTGRQIERVRSSASSKAGKRAGARRSGRWRK